MVKYRDNSILRISLSYTEVVSAVGRIFCHALIPQIMCNFRDNDWHIRRQIHEYLVYISNRVYLWYSVHYLDILIICDHRRR
jgi:hypothetical protein